MASRQTPLSRFVTWVVCFLISYFVLQALLDNPFWILFWCLVLPTGLVLASLNEKKRSSTASSGGFRQRGREKRRAAAAARKAQEQINSEKVVQDQ
jgi:hypothetical protein